MILTIFRKQILISESLTCPDLDGIMSAAEAFAFDNNLEFEKLSKKIVLIGKNEYELIIKKKNGRYKILGILR